MIVNRIKFLLIIFLFTFTFSCSKKKSSSSSANTDTSTPDTTSTDTPPAPESGTGQLVINVQDKNVDPKSVSGYVVGQQTATVQTANDGTTYINNIPPGNHDVIVTANQLQVSNNSLLGTLSLNSTIKLGIRHNGIVVKTKGTAKVDLPKVPQLGKITGKVSLDGLSNYAGIDVYIPGTTYVAKTADDGSYTFTDLPSGDHNLYFDFHGYGRGIIGKVTVAPAQEVKTSDVKLVVSKGASGKIILNNGESLSTSLTVPVTIVATTDAILMMLSEDSTFTGASWDTILTNTTYTFASGGSKSLYVRFADANGLASAGIKASVNIDTTGPTGSFTINSGATVTNSVNANLDFSSIIDDFSEVAKYRAGEDKDLSSTTYQTFTQTVNFTLSSSNGTKKVYAQFKDSVGNESSVLDASINLDMTAPTVSSISPSGSGIAKNTAVTITFSKAIDTNTVTTSNMKLLNNGTTVNASIRSSSDGTIWTILPSTDLDNGTSYTISLLSGIKDTSGNSLTPPSDSTFTTVHGWGTTETVDGGTASSSISSLQAAGISSRGVVISWIDGSTLNAGIYTTGWAIDITQISTSISSSQLVSCGNGTAYIAYIDSNQAIQLSKYDGSTWTNISSSPGSTSRSGNVAIACDKSTNGTVVVSWSDSSTATKMNFATWNGSSWTALAYISPGGSGTADPHVAIDSSAKIMVVYPYYDGSYTYRMNANLFQSGSWSSTVILDQNISGSAIDTPRIDIDSSGNFYSIWHTGDAPSPNCSNQGIIHGSQYTNGGWLNPSSGAGTHNTVLQTDNSLCALRSNINLRVAPNGTSLAMWTKGQGGTIGLSVYSNSSWSSEVSESTNYALTNSIATTNSVQISAWGSSSNNIYSILYSTYSGSSWATAATATTLSSGSSLSSSNFVMASSGDGTIFLVYGVYANSTTSLYSMKYK